MESSAAWVIPGLKVKQELEMDYITTIVCKYFGVTEEQIHSKTREHPILPAQQVIMYFARRFTRNPSRLIGKYFGKDHATALHSIRHIKELTEVDVVMRRRIKHIEEELIKERWVSNR